MNISYTLLMASLLSLQAISCSNSSSNSNSDSHATKRRRIGDFSESKTESMTGQTPNPGSEEQLVFDHWFGDVINIFPLSFERKEEDSAEAHDTTEGTMDVAANNPTVEASAGFHSPPRHQQIPTGANTFGAFAFSHLFDPSSHETPPQSDHSPFHTSEINSPAVTVDSNATSLYSGYSASKRAGNAHRLEPFGVESDVEDLGLNEQLESETDFLSEFGTSEFGSVAGEDEEDPVNDYDDEEEGDYDDEADHATD